MSLKWFRGRIHRTGSLYWCWWWWEEHSGFLCLVQPLAKMALLGWRLGPHGVVLTAGQGIYFYTLAKSYCKWFTRYILHGEPGLAVMGRFIGTPLERWNAKRVSGRVCKAVACRISSSLDEVGRHEHICGGVLQRFIGIKKTSTFPCSKWDCSFRGFFLQFQISASKAHHN